VPLRLFPSPNSLRNDLDSTIALARAAREQEFKFLLDFHERLSGKPAERASLQ
jgi:hypothetical protein